MAQTILVTGSTSGFGRLTVETLARQGYIVFAGMRAAAGKNAPAAEELRALAEREHLALHIVEIDITDDASVEQAIASIVGITDRLDVVVNNAGIVYSGIVDHHVKTIRDPYDRRDCLLHGSVVSDIDFDDMQGKMFSFRQSA